jgi:hypothetical protein
MFGVMLVIVYLTGSGTSTIQPPLPFKDMQACQTAENDMLTQIQNTTGNVLIEIKGCYPQAMP